LAVRWADELGNQTAGKTVENSEYVLGTGLALARADCSGSYWVASMVDY
jgi:hypothetical protein